MKLFKITILLAFISLGSGCTNLFQSTANKTSDEALFEDAQKYMDDRNWDDALVKFAALGADFQSRPEVIQQWAGAYAGKCGLNFIDYFTSIGESSLTGSTMFKYFMNQFTGVVVSPANCTLAQAKMEELGATAATRTDDQNLFMAILGMVKVGSYLRNIADLDGSDNLGDDTADYPTAPSAGTYDSCSAVSLSLADVTEVITGIGLITNNIAYLTVALGGSAGDIGTALATLNTYCGGGSCGKTDPATVVSGDVTVVRELLKSGPTHNLYPLGIETCAAAPCCP